MLTLFTMPKGFQGHLDIIQRNAIQSWLRLRPQCEIILLGNDPGTAEVAREYNLVHIPHIQQNEFGTPLVNDIFRKGEETASHPFVCYINTDIILLQNFMAVMTHFAPFDRRFLLIGLRWDLDLPFRWDFNQPQWEEAFRQYAHNHGQAHHIGGMDFFAYKKGLYQDIPSFALGRCVWDNWLVYQPRQTGAAVINITNAALVYHQDHDYAHVAYTPDMTGRPGIDQGPERKRNMELAGWPLPYFDLRHATHVLKANPATPR